MRRLTHYVLASTLVGLLSLPVLAQQAEVEAGRSGVQAGQDRDTTPRNVERNDNVDRNLDRRTTEGRDARQKLKPLRVSEINGMEVRNYENEDLGDIEDLVVDPNSGQIRYAAVSMGGFLGIGDDLFAVPWKAIKFQTTDDGDHIAYVDIDKQRMEDAEGFNQDNWPNFADERWVRENDRRYRVEVDTQDNENRDRVRIDRNRLRDRDENRPNRNTTPEVETDRRNNQPRVEVEVDRDNR